MISLQTYISKVSETNITINNERHYVRDIMDDTYDTRGLKYIDGNKYNNALSNLQ